MIRATTIVFTFTLLWLGPAAAKDIRHDAEQALLQAQHGEAWRAQDAQLEHRLEALRAAKGKRPNPIHIMWDDQSVGEVGIPELCSPSAGFPRLGGLSSSGPYST